MASTTGPVHDTFFPYDRLRVARARRRATAVLLRMWTGLQMLSGSYKSSATPRPVFGRVSDASSESRKAPPLLSPCGAI